MKIEKFECEDRYEAEKLSSLLSVQNDGTVWFIGISAIIGTEIVIRLKDKSSHAVVLKDKENVEKLRSVLIEVVKGNMKIHSSDFSGAVAEIIILND
ncbi:MAG TPA: hypothetical protein VE199_03675 [Nitrososphaera sp.]|nr:hypothetical protein [Nitrososphaera sp.]